MTIQSNLQVFAVPSNDHCGRIPRESFWYREMSLLIYGIDWNRELYVRLQAQQSIALAIFKRSCGHRRLGYRAKPTEFTWLIDPTGGISGHEDIGSDASIETSFRGTNHRYSVRFVRNLFQNRFSYAYGPCAPFDIGVQKPLSESIFICTQASLTSFRIDVHMHSG